MMRILLCIIVAGLGWMLISCEKDKEVDCGALDLDFAYSIGYPTDSLSATVQFTNTTQGFPTDGNVMWSVNGESAFVHGSEVIFYQNGQFNITMYYAESGAYCTTTKDFMITGIKAD